MLTARARAAMVKTPVRSASGYPRGRLRANNNAPRSENKKRRQSRRVAGKTYIDAERSQLYGRKQR